MNERDNLEYIKVLLALSGHYDDSLIDTLEKAEKSLEKRKKLGNKIGNKIRKALRVAGFSA